MPMVYKVVEGAIGYTMLGSTSYPWGVLQGDPAKLDTLVIAVFVERADAEAFAEFKRDERWK